jgi:tetratricopeptide (TPR) repeat protein
LPFFLLALVEFCLRLSGAGDSTDYFRPFRIGKDQVLVDNPIFFRRFFPPGLARIPSPLVMQAQKTSGTIRIFVLGESAALGDPRPHFGAVRYLEAMLRHRYPGQSFEVVNTAVTAINSHVIWPIARECARHQGDIWLVYMGNNEMVGPFGAATVFGTKAPSLARARTSLALQRTRLGQVTAELLQGSKPGAASQPTWRGMEMFLRNQVAPDAPARQVVYSSFERNLLDIVETGLDSGAKVVLSTVAVNLRDCPPFGSVPADPEVLTQASSAEALGDWAAATGLLQTAGARQPLSAEVFFRLAHCLLGSGDHSSAAQAFQKAVDLDTLPFRADSSVNSAIVRVGEKLQGRGLLLCDARAALAAEAPAQTPGQESFYEHVHLNFEGNYRLARAWADQIAKLLPIPANPRSLPPWPDQAQCERHLGLTDWNRVSVLQEILRRCEQPPLSSQANNLSRTSVLLQQLATLEQRLTPETVDQCRSIYLDALSHNPSDRYLHENYAEFLERAGDAAAAMEQRRIVRDLAPHSYFAHYALGTLLKEQKHLAEAETSLLKAVELAPGAPAPRTELAAVFFLLGKREQALREFETAQHLDPGNPRILLLKGEVLWKLDQRAEAVAAFQASVQSNPNYADARYKLGEKLAQLGQIQAAITELEHAVRLRPEHLKTRLNLAIAFLNLGRKDAATAHLNAALRINPRDPLALELKERVSRESATP